VRLERGWNALTPDAGLVDTQHRARGHITSFVARNFP
jgi:hypothetical protein